MFHFSFFQRTTLFFQRAHACFILGEGGGTLSTVVVRVIHVHHGPFLYYFTLPSKIVEPFPIP